MGRLDLEGRRNGTNFHTLWMRSGAFRAPQVHVREEQCNGTPVSLAPGARVPSLCSPRFGNVPCLPVVHGLASQQLGCW